MTDSGKTIAPSAAPLEAVARLRAAVYADGGVNAQEGRHLCRLAADEGFPTAAGRQLYIEALTDRLEEEAERIFARIEDMGGDGTILSGLLRGIEDGYFTGEIADSAFAYQQALEKGDKHQVGVTVHTATIEEPLEILRISHEVEKAQVAALGQRRAARDEAAVTQSLRALRENSTTDTNMIPVLLEATRREATLGEICNVLREQWGEYSEPAHI